MSVCHPHRTTRTRAECGKMPIVTSNGRNVARAYLVVAVPLPRPEPALELYRVRSVDPRQTPTLAKGAARPASGPRNPDQRTAALPRPPGIELPDGLPATKAQRVLIDPELVAQWRAEALAAEEQAKGGA
jgi:hypothetical protein